MSVNKGVPLTKDEVKLLLGLIKKNEAIISKATNATNNLLKEEAWLKVTSSFNASISSGPRRVEQLKLKWENLKKTARKHFQKIRMNNVQTGGGKAHYVPPDEILDKVAEILGATCEGYTVPFGGDADQTAVIVADEDQSTCEIFENGVCSALADETNIVSAIENVTDSIVGTPVLQAVETPTIRKFFFNSAKSNHVKQKRKLVEEDIKARTLRNKAIANYYIKKEKREETEIENKMLQNEKLKLELEEARLKNAKLISEMKNM